MAKPKNTEIAWAAGFFDGEGSTKKIRYHYKSKNGKPQSPNRNVCMSVCQTDTETLNRFLKAVHGLGRINGPYQYKPNRRPYWTWSTSCASAKKVFSILKPYLSSVKKRQYKIVTEELDIDRSDRKKGWIHD